MGIGERQLGSGSGKVCRRRHQGAETHGPPARRGDQGWLDDEPIPLLSNRAEQDNVCMHTARSLANCVFVMVEVSHERSDPGPVALHEPGMDSQAEADDLSGTVTHPVVLRADVGSGKRKDDEA
jgi:hypothetical protein